MGSISVSKLQVSNFRNLDDAIIEFGPNINCILGENGHGKTNILEAIYMIANRRSFRKKASFPQQLSLDGENPEILYSALFRDALEENIHVSGKVSTDGQLWYVNGSIKRRKPFLPTLFVNPFDAHDFFDQPSNRRKWLDQHLSILDKEYEKALKSFQSALKFRNGLLKNKPDDFRTQLDAIDPMLGKYSYTLTERRLQFIEEIKPWADSIFKNIFDDAHRLDVGLVTRVCGWSGEKVTNYLYERREKDVAAGITTYGIHKDDFILYFNGLNSLDYCSLGQQKTSYLGLLFAYIELFRYKFNSFPLVLIDDVSGELDRYRWRNLVAYLKRREFQVLITTANESFKEELAKIENAHRIFVRNGKFEHQASSLSECIIGQSN